MDAEPVLYGVGAQPVPWDGPRMEVWIGLIESGQGPDVVMPSHPRNGV
jgi:hypothetical protein